MITDTFLQQWHRWLDSKSGAVAVTIMPLTWMQESSVLMSDEVESEEGAGVAAAAMNQMEEQLNKQKSIRSSGFSSDGLDWTEPGRA